MKRILWDSYIFLQKTAVTRVYSGKQNCFSINISKTKKNWKLQRINSGQKKYEIENYPKKSYISSPNKGKGTILMRKTQRDLKCVWNLLKPFTRNVVTCKKKEKDRYLSVVEHTESPQLFSRRKDHRCWQVFCTRKSVTIKVNFTVLYVPMRNTFNYDYWYLQSSKICTLLIYWIISSACYIK